MQLWLFYYLLRRANQTKILDNTCLTEQSVRFNIVVVVCPHLLGTSIGIVTYSNRLSVLYFYCGGGVWPKASALLWLHQPSYHSDTVEMTTYVVEEHSQARLPHPPQGHWDGPSRHSDFTGLYNMCRKDDNYLSYTFPEASKVCKSRYFQV